MQNFEKSSNFKTFSNSSEQLESKMLDLQSRVKALEAVSGGHHEKPDSFSHLLAEHVDSVIGLRESISTKEPCLRYTWTLLVTAGFAVTVFFMYETLREFRHDRKYTRVELIPQHTYDYPPFMLCNRAWFDTSKALDLGLTVDGLLYSLAFTDRAFNPRISLLSDIPAAAENFNTVFHRHQFDSLSEYYKYISVDFERRQTKEEFYAGSEPAYLLDDDENPQNASKVFDPNGAVCHEFRFRPLDGHSGSLVKTEKVHVKYADRSLGLIKHAHEWVLYFSEGITVRYTLPIVVPTGGKVYLRVQGQIFDTVSSPKVPCISPDRSFSAECMADCLNRIYLATWKCKMFWLTTKQSLLGQPDEFCNYIKGAYDLANSSESRESLHRSEQKSLGTIDKRARKQCFAECPRHCYRKLFDASLHGIGSSFDEFFGPEEQELIEKSNTSVTSFFIMNDAIRQSGFVQFTEVSSYSFVEFTSNVGGTLGLFLGGALMSFAQLLLFIFGYLRGRVLGGVKK